MHREYENVCSFFKGHNEKKNLRLMWACVCGGNKVKGVVHKVHNVNRTVDYL